MKPITKKWYFELWQYWKMIHSISFISNNMILNFWTSTQMQLSYVYVILTHIKILKMSIANIMNQHFKTLWMLFKCFCEGDRLSIVIIKSKFAEISIKLVQAINPYAQQDSWAASGSAPHTKINTIQPRDFDVLKIFKYLFHTLRLIKIWLWLHRLFLALILL